MQHITYAELQIWQSEGKPFQLIDVREPNEHEDFNIGGELIPLDEILRRHAEIHTEHPVVFYCKRGIRSQIAIQRLARKFTLGQFYNLQGGILPIRHTLKPH